MSFLLTSSNGSFEEGKKKKQPDGKIGVISRIRAEDPAVHLSFAADPSANQILEIKELQKLMYSMAQKPNVESLSLQGNILSNCALGLLMDTIRSSTNRIRSLNLSMCGLGDVKAFALFEACNQQRWPILRYLDLTCNHITNEGAKKIAHHLMGSVRSFEDPYQSDANPIHTLVLRFNNITCEGVLHLLRAPGLRVLDVRYCSLDVSENHRYLLQGIAESRTCTWLYMEGNEIPRKLQAQMEHVLSYNKFSSLSIENIFADDLVGPLREAARYITSETPKIGQFYPKVVVDEIKKVIGEFVIARGLIRDASQITGMSEGRRKEARACIFDSKNFTTRSTSRIEAVEVDASPMERCQRTFFLCSPRHFIHSSPGPELPRAPPCPMLKRVAQSLNLKEDAGGEEGGFAGFGITTGSPCSRRGSSQGAFSPLRGGPPPSGCLYQPPMPERIVTRDYRYQYSDWYAQRKAILSLQISTNIATAVRLLNFASAEDLQCFTILNMSPTEGVGILREGSEQFPEMPKDLVTFSALPSDIEAVKNDDRRRIGGLAKLLYILLYSPCIELRQTAEMTDIPSGLRASEPRSIASFRSMRVIENRNILIFLKHCVGYVDFEIISNLNNFLGSIHPKGTFSRSEARSLTPTRTQSLISNNLRNGIYNNVTLASPSRILSRSTSPQVAKTARNSPIRSRTPVLIKNGGRSSSAMRSKTTGNGFISSRSSSITRAWH